MTTMLECDQCHKRVPQQGHVGWFVLDRSGIDVSGFGEADRYPYHFCSLACVAGWAANQTNLFVTATGTLTAEQAQAIEDGWRRKHGTYTWPGTERPA